MKFGEVTLSPTHIHSLRPTIPDHAPSMPHHASTVTPPCPYGAPQWRVLNIWATAFEAREGRKPKVWLDKACINQQKISESLAGLPIYLSGCSELVVLMGETYLSRLWCVHISYRCLPLSAGAVL